MNALPWLIVLAASRPEVEARIQNHVHDHAAETVQLVEDTAKINSGTLNVEGVKAVGAIFEAKLKAVGLKTRWAPAPEGSARAPTLVAEQRGSIGPKLLLIGHLDTVFEPSDDFDAVRHENGFLFGPGVYDTKGGNAVIVAALDALRAAGALEGLDVTVVLSGDEERVAKPIAEARAALVEAAKRADYALGFEPAFGGQRVSTARRGSSSWTLEVTADGGHSSGVGAKGYGALYEAARILEGMRKLLDASDTLTLNPGLLAGGAEAERFAEGSAVKAQGKTNRIPAKVVAAGDLRFIDEAQKTETRQQLNAIAKASLPGTQARFQFIDGYPAMAETEESKRLFEKLSAISESLGDGPLSLVPPTERGAADISFAAPHVKGGLAGLGVAGGGAHDPSEKMEIAHLEKATLRAALLMLRLKEEGTPEN